MHSGTSSRLPNMFSSVPLVWSQHSDGCGDKACNCSDNLLLASLCHCAPWRNQFWVLTAMSAHYTNKKVPHPACLRSPHPHPPCISAVGGKHYAGLAHNSGSLKILSWPLAVTLLNDRGEQLHIHHKQTLKEKRGRERKSCFFILEGKRNQKNKKQT